MSKANSAIEKKDTFLQHVSLKNYKSIKDVEIDFKPGLNIIIGKNGSGKTNFVNGLYKILNYEYTEFLASNFFIQARFKEDKIVIKTNDIINLSKEFTVNSHHSFLKNKNLNLEINDEVIANKENTLAQYSPIYALANKDFYLDVVLIKYGISYKVNDVFINIPFSFAFVNNGQASSDLTFLLLAEKQTKFVGAFMERFNRFLAEISESVFNSKFDIKTKILEFSNQYFEGLNKSIAKYSPVLEIRINPDFNIIIEDDGQKQTITNFYLEFHVDNAWIIFNLLSDGTKRLFYIITEVLSTYNENINLYEKELKTIFIEEPELGIHPHQLHQLMQFIREQSKEKQIIITTHSPQVLDALGPDELDRVVICHSDPKNGTQLSHLTEKEIAKAKKYMKEEAFLSDYWRFSDLEPA